MLRAQFRRWRTAAKLARGRCRYCNHVLSEAPGAVHRYRDFNYCSAQCADDDRIW